MERTLNIFAIDRWMSSPESNLAVGVLGCGAMANEPALPARCAIISWSGTGNNQEAMRRYADPSQVVYATTLARVVGARRQPTMQRCSSTVPHQNL